MIYSIVTVLLYTIQVVLLMRLPVRFLVTCLFIDCMYKWNFLHPWSNFCLDQTVETGSIKFYIIRRCMLLLLFENIHFGACYL